MRDISRKATTLRTAAARATLRVAPATIDALRAGALPKGDPLPVARVAAVQAAKQTSALIPYCHPIAIDHVEVDFEIGAAEIAATASVTAIDRTGVEMEALLAASIAALTLYDMLKPIDPGMEIAGITLCEKRGGKSSFAGAQGPSRRAAVLVVSDSVAGGVREDRSGGAIAERLAREGIELVESATVPDDAGAIAAALERLADGSALDLVITTGGTGVGPRDVTAEATARVIEREVPGIAEALRAFGQSRTPFAMLSRGKAGLRGKTLIVNLPGSPKGVAESLDALFPGVLHAFAMIAGGGHDAPEERRR